MPVAFNHVFSKPVFLRKSVETKFIVVKNLDMLKKHLDCLFLTLFNWFLAVQVCYCTAPFFNSILKNYTMKIYAD